MDNIQYGYKTRDGLTHPINVRGAGNLTEAIFEVITSLMKGGIETDGEIYQVDDIVAYVDLPG